MAYTDINSEDRLCRRRSQSTSTMSSTGRVCTPGTTRQEAVLDAKFGEYGDVGHI